MPHEVAYDQLIAAAEAWPFSSEASFRLCILDLARTPHGLFTTATQALADDLESWLRPRAGGLSLETLRRLCDHTWFDECPPRRTLADVIVRLAAKNLQPDGPRITLLRDNDLAARLRHFRWLSLLLPPDLLVAARYTDDNIEPPDDHVSLLTPQLFQLLREKPVAETHLHLGAAMSFGVFWTALLPALGHDPPAASNLRDAPLGGGERFLHVLTGASIARALLAAFLRRRTRGEAKEFFTEDFEAAVPLLSNRLAWPWGPENAGRALRLALRAAVRGEVHPALPHPRLRALHRVLHGTPTGSPQTLDDLLRRDPLATWLAPGKGKALPETRFAARAIAYLLGSSGRKDTAFASVFWQYQRVRGLTYRHLVQEPGTAGLDWFSLHYNRLWPLRHPLAGCRFEAALALQSRDLHLGALEARIAPPESWARLRSDVRAVASRAANFEPAEPWEAPEVALLVNFIKQRLMGRGEQRRLHADPAQVAHGVRFGAWGYECLRSGLAIETALTATPELLLVLRGIDIASTELAVPTWPIVPLFRRLREASRRAAAIVRRCRPRWNVEPLRVTCHAGEDYGRLVEGLRRVHELIEFGVLCPGDRIGHGICLGDDPVRWARRAARVPQPAEDRLDDLLWELDRYGRAELSVDSSRYAYARAEVLRLGRLIYGPRADLDALVESRRMRHDPRWLARFGYPFRQSIQPGNSEEDLLYRHLSDRNVFLRGQQLVEVTMSDGELTMLRAAQAWLRHVIAGLEITVESNPSSNLLVGDFVAIEAHPSFSMAPLPGRSSSEGGPVMLSLNTDDPITFASSLADEYAHMYGALLRSSVSASDALAWLAERRDQGYRSRFSLPASMRPEHLRVIG